MSIKRLDSQFMLCLLRLMSWPNLGNMHGDLVDDLRLICALLAKRPMVGFLIARRLKLPVDKTFALLSVLHSKGHVTALGVNTIDLYLNALESSDTFKNTAARVITPIVSANSANFLGAQNSVSAASASARRDAQVLGTDVDVPIPVVMDKANATKSESSKVTSEPQNSGDVLNQLWRVLNTDIVMSKAARASIDPAAPAGKEAGDVLSQLWFVLNTDIGSKQETVKKAAIKTDAKSSKSNSPNTAITSKKINSVLKPDTEDEAAIRDVNGNIIAPDFAKDDATKADQAKDVMSQLWSVLNTDIAFKRQSGNEAANEQSAEKAKEVSEVMAHLWRVLNTEIASKRQSHAKDGKESLSDTTREANDKLSKLWRILDAQIVLKKQPTTYLMTDDPLKVVKKEAQDTSGEAVARLSQLWQVLNSEIALALPAERRSASAKRR